MTHEKTKRIRRWLAVALVAALAYAYGYLSFRLDLFPAGAMESLVSQVRFSAVAPLVERMPAGRWRPARPAPSPSHVATLGAPSSDQQDAALGLPYAAGTLPATVRQGVTVHLRDLAEPGFNLIVSGHAPEAILIDMEGRRLHSWSAKASSKAGDGLRRRAAPYWRRVRLLDDGGLLAIHEGSELVRIAADSSLVWSHPCECHHDLELDAAGNILVLDRREMALPHINPDRLVLTDWIVTLSPEGVEIGAFSVLEAFERSEFSRLLHGMDREGDLFHTNSLARMDGSAALPMFAAGNLLISLRHLDIVAVIDPAEQRVVWALTGLWRRQHDPVLVGTGRILVFDNLAGPERSRVLEVDPVTQRIAWSYHGSDTSPFYSETCGTNQRLSGGNTLITESDQGRAFEVTPDGRIVWEFLSPWRTGASGELVATLFEVTRLPASLRVERLPAGLPLPDPRSIQPLPLPGRASSRRQNRGTGRHRAHRRTRAPDRIGPRCSDSVVALARFGYGSRA